MPIPYAFSSLPYVSPSIPERTYDIDQKLSRSLTGERWAATIRLLDDI